MQEHIVHLVDHAQITTAKKNLPLQINGLTNVVFIIIQTKTMFQLKMKSYIHCLHNAMVYSIIEIPNSWKETMKLENGFQCWGYIRMPIK
jgi:hypothetical protein